MRWWVASLVVLGACWRGPPPPPAEPLRPPPATPRLAIAPIVWQGPCGDEHSGWETVIDVSLSIRDEGRDVVATGTLSFIGRTTDATLRGTRDPGRRERLRGELVEVGGQGVTWDIRMELTRGGGRIRGRLFELVDDTDEEDLMCEFDVPI